MDKLFRVMSLPFEYDEMELFIQKNKEMLMEQIVLSVEYALKNEYPSVEVFSFKNSDFIVILEQSEFKDNINNIFEYYVQTEKYEFCERLVKLKKEIEQHEQKHQERYKSKSSSKRKDQR